MTPQDLDVATRTLFGEARGEPVEGQQAVVWVIRNRAGTPGWWGNSITSVCLKPFQFSCWLTSDPNRARLTALSTSDPAYIHLSAIVEAVMASDGPDPTHGATNYKVRGTKASWDSVVAKRGVQPVSIGHHDFFKIGLH